MRVRLVVLVDPSGKLTRWPIDGGDPAEISGLESGESPVMWSDDGRALFVVAPGFPLSVSRLELASGKRTPWTTLHPSDVAGLRKVNVVMSPNGKYWALITSKLFTDLYVIDGLR